MSQRPIFITARFRSGSTLLWNMFRQMPGCISFYEPCNDSLISHLEYSQPPDPNHRNVSSSYWEEYRPILADLRARHMLEFGVSRLYLDAGDEFPELEHFIQYLVTAADGRVPVLQFNRVDFRLPWLRKRFPEAFLLYLRRNHRDNWFSIARALPGNTWRDPLQDARESLVLWSVALSHVFPFLFSPLVETSYHRHYLLWRLSALAGERLADLTLDFDQDILADPLGSAKRLAEIAGQPDADLDAVAQVVVEPERGRWRELADEAWYDAAEAKCDALLDSLGLLENFGRLPLAEIRAGQREAWMQAHEESAEMLSFAAARMAGSFRDQWFRTRNTQARVVVDSQNELARLQQELEDSQRFREEDVARLDEFLCQERAARKMAEERAEDAIADKASLAIVLEQTQRKLAICEGQLRDKLNGTVLNRLYKWASGRVRANDRRRFGMNDGPQAGGSSLPCIIDLIYRSYPYDAKVQGPDALEWHEGRAFRWFCGRELNVSFALPAKIPLVLRMRFANVLPGQSLRLEINGAVVAEHTDLHEGQLVEGEFRFVGKTQNLVRLHFGITSKDSGIYPDDLRDLSIMCYEFVVTPDVAEQGGLAGLLGSLKAMALPLFESSGTRAAQKFLRPLSGDRFSQGSIAHLGDPEANARLNRQEYESRATVLRSLPSVVTLVMTSHCNNRTPCVICDRNTRLTSCDSEIDDGILEKVTPLLKTARYVLLHCGGEAMFSRYFDEVIARIEPPTRVSFATNAMLMHNKRADRMLEKDIMAGFVVSMDAATRGTYEIMRPGSKFDTVVANVAYYIAQAKRLGRTESNITLNMTLCQANIHEAPLLVDLAASIGAYGVDYNHLNSGLTHVVRTSAGWDWDYVAQAQFPNKEFHDQMLLEAYYKAKDLGINFSLVGRPFLGENAERYQEIVCDMTCQVAFQEGEGIEHWHCPQHKKVAHDVPSCFKPWQETVIQPNGAVRTCYFHELSQWALGHLNSMDFMRIWNSDQMVLTRRQFYERAFARSCAESQPCMHRGRM